jgi:pre-rRNA-processing protein TSR3
VIYEFVIDKTERPNKCSILPLDGRADFRLTRVVANEALPAFSGDCLLHPDGVPFDRMTEEARRAVKTLSFIDCNWLRLPGLVTRIAKPLPTLVAIPPGFVTAYPRRNKQNLDPEAGLATIEAVFIAAAYCGVWDETLLAKFHWAKEFLAANAERLAPLRKHAAVIPSRA